MALSDLERRVADEIERRRDELVALASDLVGFEDLVDCAKGLAVAAVRFCGEVAS